MSDIYDRRQDEYIQFWNLVGVCIGVSGEGGGRGWEAAGGWKVAGRC